MLFARSCFLFVATAACTLDCRHVFAAESAAAQPLNRAQIAAIAKPATALIEVEGKSFGSSFCIHKAGFFITNRHVLNELLPSDKIWIVLNPSLPTERKLKARVCKMDDDADLALLAVVQAGGALDATAYSPLALGDDARISELTELVAFGYPFGVALAEKGKYPAISANVTNVSSLRRSEGALEFIQVDSSLNPGNSGGPVLSADGKVAGMVVAGIQGAGINLLIPASRIRNFMKLASVDFQLPTVAASSLAAPCEFSARILFAEAQSPEPELELVIHSKAEPDRVYKMFKSGGAYSVKVPYLTKLYAPPLAVKVKLADAELNTVAKDAEISIADRVVRLADVVNISVGATALVELQGGEKVSGSLRSGAVLNCKIGRGFVPVPLDDVVSVAVERLPCGADVACSLIVKSGGVEVSRIRQTLSGENSYDRRFALLSSGIFSAPRRGQYAISVAKFKVIKKGGGDKSQVFEVPLSAGVGSLSLVPARYMATVAGQQNVRSVSSRQMSVNIVGVRVNDCDLQLSAPPGRSLEVGEYLCGSQSNGAPRSGAAEFQLIYKGNWVAQPMGSFRIWELEYDIKTSRLKRLAVDFVMQDRGGDQVYGILRFNSTYE